MLLARSVAVVGYLLAVQIVAVPLLGIFFVKGLGGMSAGCSSPPLPALADIAIGI